MVETCVSAKAASNNNHAPHGMIKDGIDFYGPTFPWLTKHVLKNGIKRYNQRSTHTLLIVPQLHCPTQLTMPMKIRQKHPIAKILLGLPTVHQQWVEIYCVL